MNGSITNAFILKRNLSGEWFCPNHRQHEIPKQPKLLQTSGIHSERVGCFFLCSTPYHSRISGISPILLSALFGYLSNIVLIAVLLLFCITILVHYYSASWHLIYNIVCLLRSCRGYHPETNCIILFLVSFFLQIPMYV